MTVNRFRSVGPTFAPRIGAASASAPAENDGQASGAAQGHAHPHHEHAGDHGAAGHATSHGPTPRPRKPLTGKAAKSRRRRSRGGVAADDDEIEFHEHDEDGVAAVGFRDANPDGGDDQEEGGDDRSRHERLRQIRRHHDEPSTGAAGMKRLPQWTQGANLRLAMDRFAAEACRLVAQWHSGAGTGAELRARQLALLESLQATRGPLRLDSGGLARVKSLLLRHAGAGGGASPNMNLMLPMLLLARQRLYKADQLDEAVARLSLDRAKVPR